tara:strand:- start:9399 stop:10007 length:609 start_codon:yes stop_codon:yes gene_type:complete
MADEINWDINIEDMPTEDVNEWEFNLRPANDKGESDIIQGRVDPSLGRVIDELIQESKGSGLPLKTRADFVRLAVFRCAGQLQRYLSSQNESITHYLLLEKQAMAEAQKSAMLERVLTSVQSLTKGLIVLSADHRKDWTEINKRITAFLKPVMDMRVSDPFLSKLYVTELFEYSRFKDILEKLKENKSISRVISEAEKFYES